MIDTRHSRVLLVGMMGAGKTTIGNALSALIGWPYLDNDECLARAMGKSTKRVLDEDGPAALRRAESRALDVALTEGGPLIAGVAGGIVLDPLDRQRLHAGGFVVWLRAPIDLLAKRVAGTHRPWLGEDPAKAMSALYAGRAALYAESSAMIIDVDSADADLLAGRIAAELSR